MITNADFRRRSSQALAAMALDRRGSVVAATGQGNKKTHPRLQPRAGSSIDAERLRKSPLWRRGSALSITLRLLNVLHDRMRW
jgi:hypothetical protein